MGFILGVLQLLIFTAIGGVVFGFITYNKLQRLGQEIREARSNVQVAVSKKLTLVNQLIDIVRNYQEAEQFTYLKISQDSNESAITAAYQQTGAMVSTIMAAAERFPELKASEQYHRLIDSIQGCEADILRQRQVYNFHVKTYNAYMLSVPTVLIARPLGFSSAPFLEFEHDGTTDSTSLKQFTTDDGERLRELLSKGGQELGKIGRQVARQTATAGRTAAGMVRQASTPEPSASVDDAPSTPLSQFYYQDSTGMPRGPLSKADLIALWARSEIGADTKVIGGSATDWTNASSVLEAH
jgi:LemA protein